MKRKMIYRWLVLLCTVALAACSSAAPASTPSTTTEGNGSSAVQAVNPAGRINLNTASSDEFVAAIPGLGNRMVREFMEYRPYISIQQFRREIGKYVDESQVTAYENYVYVPIAINDSDAETLQQIPGLSAEEAQVLIAARPFASAEDFLAKLGQYVSADELEIAKGYLGGK
jgi:DNA uptake protein ComE-like DNA-binding protein